MMLQDPIFNDLSRSLDTAALRQKVISNNIANLNTPYFKRSYVPFDEEFARADKRLALSRTHPVHFPGKSSVQDPRVVNENITTRRTDQSNVDLDQEMLDLVTNQLRYNTLIQRISGQFANMRYIINDGRA